MTTPQKWYVYIVCCRDRTFYTGVTTDVTKRVERHNSGNGAKYTRGRRPVKLVYFEEHETKGSSLSRECQLKRLKRAEKEILVRQFKTGKL